MQKQTVIFEENPKWRIYKGKWFCQIEPLSRDGARILYLTRRQVGVNSGLIKLGEEPGYEVDVTSCNCKG